MNILYSILYAALTVVLALAPFGALRQNRNLYWSGPFSALALLSGMFYFSFQTGLIDSLIYFFMAIYLLNIISPWLVNRGKFVARSVAISILLLIASFIIWFWLVVPYGFGMIGKNI